MQVRNSDNHQNQRRKTTETDPYIAFKAYQIGQLSPKDEKDAGDVLQALMDELKIRYDRNNKEDFCEIAKILFYILQYPSTEMAELHAQANKIGYSSEYNRNGTCPCCGLIQPYEYSLNFSRFPPYDYGTSIPLCIEIYYDFVYLFICLFFIFGIFSLISNTITSHTYESDTNGGINEKSLQSYVMPVLFSFGSQQFYPTGFAKISIFLQGWLGVIALLFWLILLDSYAQMNQRMIKSRQAQNVSVLSLLCLNMPYEYSKNKQLLEQKIQEQIQACVKHLKVDVNVSDIKPIKIKNFDYAMPFKVDVNELKNLQLYEKITEKVSKLKQKFKKWIKQRTSSSDFKVERAQRQQLYKQFRQLRHERYQAYLELVKEYQHEIKNSIEKQEIKRVDTFVTFKSQEASSVILMAQKEVPKSLKQSCSQFWQKQIEWVQAPAPEDVKWENFGQGMCERGLRFLVTILMTLVILSASFLILYNLQRFKLYVSANNKDSKDSTIVSSLVSIGVSLPIYAINFAIKTLFDYLSRNWERNITYSNMQTSLGWKTVLVMMMNSILIPIIINLVYRENIYGVDGLANDVFFFALTNAVLSFLLKIINISFILNRLSKWYSNWICNKWDTNQIQLNKDSQYMPFEIGLEYASTIFTFLYTCFFAPLQPIIILFSGLGLLFSIFAAKVVLARMSKIPVNCNEETHLSLMKIAYLGPLLFAIGSFFWTDIYAMSVSHYRVSNFFLLVLSIIALFSGQGYIRKILQFICKNPSRNASERFKNQLILETQKNILRIDYERESQNKKKILLNKPIHKIPRIAKFKQKNLNKEIL